MPRGSGVFLMDTETNTKILFSDLNWCTFYSLPKGTQILLSDTWEKSIKAMCRSRSWLLCFFCRFLPLAHGECWVSSGGVLSRPGRCCGPPCAAFPPLLVGHEDGLRPVGRQGFGSCFHPAKGWKDGVVISWNCSPLAPSKAKFSSCALNVHGVNSNLQWCWKTLTSTANFQL